MELEKKTKIKFNIIAIFCVVIFCFSISPVDLQNDTFYTIKIGEHILENGIDMQDPFSWHELPYTYPHWLYDVTTYLVYSVGGYTGIYVSTVILASLLGIIIYLTNVKLSKNHLTSFIITLGVIFLIKSFVAARAQLVTFLLFALTVYSIEMFLDSKKKRYIAYLIIIPILIANIHLAVWPFYFVLYLPYIAEYLGCLFFDSQMGKKFSIFMKRRKIKRLVKKGNNEEKIAKLNEQIDGIRQKIEKGDKWRLERRQKPYKIKIEKKSVTKWLILIMIICAFTGLLTPLEKTPYTYLYNTMQGNTTNNINEHLPLVLINNKEFMCLILIFLGLTIFTDTNIKLRDLFMIGGLLFLSFMSRRQTSLYILLGSYILNRIICEFVNKYDPYGSVKMTKTMTKVLGVILTIIVVLVMSIYFFKPKLDDVYVAESSYPVNAVEYIKENLDIENMRLYNEYNYGSYLLLNDIPVFIDSRADLYAPEFNGGKDIFTDFINISSINLYYEDKFKEYDITHVICYKNAKLNIFLQRDTKYEELYSDDYFIIYERIV